MIPDFISLFQLFGWLSKEQKNSPLIDLPKLTLSYLEGKKGAEVAVRSMRSRGFNATSIRLPIQSGENDHTQRISFYLDRIDDGSGLILVNGGSNIFQLANNEDVALALTRAILLGILDKSAVWDALPDNQISVKELVRIISGAQNVQVLAISSAELLERLPEYLAIEPFWREYPLKKLKNNIFEITNTIARKPIDWLPGLNQVSRKKSISQLRAKEVELIQEVKLQG